MKKIPFPQANNLDMVYKIIMEIDESGWTKYDLVKREGFAEREGAYYLDALYFLSVVEKYKTRYFLSEIGSVLKKKCIQNGRKELAIYIKQKKFFSDLIEIKSSLSTDKDYREYVTQKVSNEFQLGVVTARRRASTAVAWVNWIEKYLKDT